VRAEIEGDAQAHEALGTQLAQRLLELGADALIAPY
jgi:hypothetical protein